MVTKSRFEKMKKSTDDVTFEISKTEGDNSKRGKILAMSSLNSGSYDVDVDTRLRIWQEESCGAIYLDQEQGKALAEHLIRIFL